MRLSTKRWASGDDVRKVVLAALATALDDRKEEAKEKPGLTGVRAVATNPVPYFDVNWDDLSLGVFPGPRFERNLDDPKRHQFLDDQPDIYFGGPVITSFARAWPPA